MAGMSASSISKSLGMGKSTVCYWLKKAKTKGTVGRKPGSGGKRKTTTSDDQYIATLAKRDRSITAHEIREHSDLMKVSERTIQRRIRESTGFKSYWAIKKPLISEENRLKRLAFVQEHRDKEPEEWHNVLWSDESPFALRYDGPQRVWRLGNERYASWAVKTTVKHPLKINVWGCFCATGLGRIYWIKDILDGPGYHKILQNQMFPSARHLFGNDSWVFQQDNDPKHTAKKNKRYLANKRVNVLKWPAQSPDLNPIENLWSILDQKMKKRTPNNADELFACIEEAWCNLDQDLLQRLAESMPNRCQAVLDAKGYATKY